jgi:hypothetical protein
MKLLAALCVVLAMCVSTEDMVDREVINLSVEPRLHLVKKFASDEEMDYMIKNVRFIHLTRRAKACDA